MKNRMFKICVLIFTLLLLIIVSGCGEIFIREVNEKPDDDISKAIYEAVGRKKVYYWGKKFYDSEGLVVYEYLVHDYEDENVLTNMVEASNAVLEEKESTEKISLAIWEEISGGYESVANLRTYYDGEDKYAQYDSFQTLYIRGAELSHKSSNPYNKPSTYINLPNIKSLIVSKKIAKIAEEEGIDWYEIWPDLEYYEVLED